MKKLLIEKFKKNLINQNNLKKLTGGYGCPDPCDTANGCDGPVSECDWIRDCCGGSIFVCESNGGMCWAGFY